MKITLRTVSGESFQLEAEASTTVGQLKEQVEVAKSIPKDAMKLVYKGKVLDDNSLSVEQAQISEQGFVVVFVQASKKAEPKPAEVSRASFQAGITAGWVCSRLTDSVAGCAACPSCCQLYSSCSTGSARRSRGRCGCFSYPIPCSGARCCCSCCGGGLLQCGLQPACRLRARDSGQQHRRDGVPTR